MWKAEALWAAQVSPWRPLHDVSNDELERVLEAAHRKMMGRLNGVRGRSRVYRRVGRPCPRCGEAIRSRPQGDNARMAYWCPRCQVGEGLGAQ
jgi:formamidopyrimidine-DNA glycosylase